MNEFDDSEFEEDDDQNSSHELNIFKEECFIPRDEFKELKEKSIELGYFELRDEKYYNNNKNNDFKDYFIETKKSNKPLFNDGLKKECSKCHVIKHYNEFSERKDLKIETSSIRSRCKKCRVTDFAVKNYKNKLKVATNIYQGKFKGKCSKCQTDIKLLPVLEFHHLKPSLKTISWKNIPKKNWKETMEILEQEKVELLCRNCHTKEGSKIFNKYHEIILKKDLYDFPGLVIDKMVYKYIIENQREYNKKDKFLVLEWIKKRRIVEDLYNGKCVGCKRINISENLPSIEFHHPINSKIEKKLRWNNIRNNNLEYIAQLLIKEECICLCSNCHKLIHSNQFEGNLHQIFNAEFTQEIKEVYKRIKRNIKDFKINDEKCKNPLNKIYSYGENWKKFLLNIYALSVNKNKRLVEAEELTNRIGTTKRNINKNLKKLKEMNLIEVQQIKKYPFIKLTQNAYKELNSLLPFLKKYKNIHKKIPDNIRDREIKDLIKLSNKLDFNDQK